MLITVRDVDRRAKAKLEFKQDVARLRVGQKASRAFETDIYVTNVCNLRCSYCYFYFEDYFVQPQHHAKENVSLKHLKTLAERLSGHTYCLVVLGGEPFSRRDFGQFLEHVRQQDIPSVRVSTNGLLLRSRQDLLPLVDTLTVSIDALRIGQYPEQMNRLLADLRYLRQKHGSDLPTVVPSWTTGSTDDFDRDVKPILDFCIEQDFIMKFLPLKKDQHADWEKEREITLKALAYAGPDRVTNDPIHTDSLSNEFTRDNCLVQGNQFYLDFDGYFIYPCDEYSHQKVGSLVDSDIPTLLAQAEAQYGSYPSTNSICAHCPSGCHSDNSFILRNPSRQLRWLS